MDQANINGITPLFISSMQGHHEVVKLLLAKDADVDHANIIGATPLFLSSQNGHQEVVKLLLAKEAMVD